MTQNVDNRKRANSELKPCPYCGGTAQWWIKGDANPLASGSKRLITVQCSKCGAEQRTGALRFSTEWLQNKAIEKWNLRTEIIPNRDKQN